MENWRQEHKAFIGSLEMFMIPILIGIIYYSRLPQKMVVHFNSNNVADGFAPKWVVLFGVPLLLLVIHWVVVLDGKGNPRRSSQPIGMQKLSNWVMPVLSTGLQIVFISYTLKERLNILVGAIIIIGIALMILGTYLPAILLTRGVSGDHPGNEKSRSLGSKQRNLAGAACSILGALCILLPMVICVT